uniref:Uncharacterized protein n=2 Tax=Physcomitrium patens TaxID=3218 RepID=A0A7I4EHD9_PHYPA
MLWFLNPALSALRIVLRDADRFDTCTKMKILLIPLIVSLLHLVVTLLVGIRYENPCHGSLVCNDNVVSVKVEVNSSAAVATVDEHFLCATLDWWPPEKCDYGTCAWGNTSLLNVDLSNHLFEVALRDLSPLRIRLGGSLQDQVVYDIGDLQVECRPFEYNASHMFNFQGGCLSMERWTALLTLFNKTSTKVAFGLNALYNRPKLASGAWGPWDPSNAHDFIQYTIAQGFQVDAWQLGVSQDLVEKILNPQYLDGEKRTFGSVNELLQRVAPSTGAWIGEAGGAYNSGRHLVTDAFAFSFWYLDQLGMAASLNNKVYCRQSFIGGNYGLLNKTYQPNPDYFSALLWNRLMGTQVLMAKSGDNASHLRVYAHCTRDSNAQGGVTVLLINLSNTTTYEVEVSLTARTVTQYMKETFEGLVSIFTPSSERLEYHLTAPANDLHSQNMLLNGKLLQRSLTGQAPELTPLKVGSQTPINVSPLSITIAVIQNAGLRFCKTLPAPFSN